MAVLPCFSTSATSPENTAAESDSACSAISCWLPRIAQVQAEAQSGSRAKRPRATRATAVTLASGRVNTILLGVSLYPGCLYSKKLR